MLLELKDINKTYNNGQPLHVLKGINLGIEKGEFVSIMGASGSGKSTLIQMFNGLLKPTSGTITYDGEPIDKDGKLTKEEKKQAKEEKKNYHLTLRMQLFIMLVQHQQSQDRLLDQQVQQQADVWMLMHLQ